MGRFEKGGGGWVVSGFAGGVGGVGKGVCLRRGMGMGLMGG